MQLVIRRDQAAKKGMLGGNKGVDFSLFYQLRLTPYEAQMVEQYRLDSYPLTYRTINGQQIPSATVAQALTGIAQTMPSVEVLVSNEQVIKDAAQGFKTLLDVASTFGGEEVIEIE